MKKPKIAVMVPRYGIVDRGVETFTANLVKNLRRDFEFEIFSRKNIFSLPAEKAPRLPLFLRRFFLSPIDIEMLTFSIAVLPKLLFGKFDLIFCQNGVWGAIICRMVRMVKGTPFIYRSAGGKEPPIVRQKPNIYIATTPEIKSWIERFDPKQKVILISNGVDTNQFSPSVKPIKLELEKPIYLCNGALIPAKRIDLAIKAVSKLIHGSLLIIGDGPLKKETVKMATKMLGDKRFLLTKVPYQEIAGYYSASDVFTLPSQDEPFGIVYLEALACGLPVVATDDASRRYIIGKAGILCDVSNIDDYTDVLKRAANTKFNDLPQKQAQKFSWEVISGKYRNIFNSFSRTSFETLGN